MNLTRRKLGRRGKISARNLDVGRVISVKYSAWRRLSHAPICTLHTIETIATDEQCAKFSEPPRSAAQAVISDVNRGKFFLPRMKLASIDLESQRGEAETVSGTAGKCGLSARWSMRVV